MTTDTETTTPPTCDRHGEMVARTEPGTPEQEWCGRWFDCADPFCRTSVLIPSPALAATYNDGLAR